MEDTRTHYVPAFTTRGPAHTERAVCGSFVPLGRRVTVEQEPTCWGCKLWLDEVERPSEGFGVYFCAACGKEMRYPAPFGLCFRCELDADLETLKTIPA